MKLIQFFSLVILIFLSGCSHSTSKSEESSEPVTLEPAPYRKITRLIPYTLRVRRPPGESVNPRVGPGGPDYRSQPLPDAKFDCESPHWLFREIHLEKARTCLASLSAPDLKIKSVHYRLRRGATPYLELEDADGLPPCMKESLSTIPVPREIFFQSYEEGNLLCYSSRLDVEANEYAGLRLPTARLNLIVDIPIEKFPTNVEEMRLLLLAWVLAPFRQEDGMIMPSQIVPDSICRACLGEKGMLRPDGPPMSLWP